MGINKGGINKGSTDEVTMMQYQTVLPVQPRNHGPSKPILFQHFLQLRQSVEIRCRTFSSDDPLPIAVGGIVPAGQPSQT